MCYTEGADEHIVCLECWKGHMVEVEMHLYLKVPGEKKRPPLIITQYFCTECQKLQNEQ
jgi:hypothetical protein